MYSTVLYRALALMTTIQHYTIIIFYCHKGFSCIYRTELIRKYRPSRKQISTSTALKPRRMIILLSVFASIPNVDLYGWFLGTVRVPQAKISTILSKEITNQAITIEEEAKQQN